MRRFGVVLPKNIMTLMNLEKQPTLSAYQRLCATDCLIEHLPVLQRRVSGLYRSERLNAS